MGFATAAALDRILGEIAPLESQSLIQRYLRERQVNGTRLTTLTNDANHLRALAAHIAPRPVVSLTRDDITAFFSDRRALRRWRSGKTESTRATTLGVRTLNLRKQIVRQFVRWMRGTEDFPPEVKWVKSSRHPDGDALPVDQVLSREDLHALIKSHDSPQGQALLAALYDSGMRAGEFCSLRVCDVAFDAYGAVLTLPSGGRLKTGQRRVRVLHCTPYLRAWMNVHPKRGRRDAPLWLSTANRNKGDALTETALYGIVTRSGRLAGLRKDIWPHLFRHSRATECAKEGWPEADMRAYFGWAKGSDMPSHYVHLSGKDYEEAMLRRAGKLVGGVGMESPLKPRLCQCGHENAATADYCGKPECGKPLTVEVAQLAERSQAQLLIEMLGSDGNLLDQMLSKVLQRARSVAEKS